MVHTHTCAHTAELNAKGKTMDAEGVRCGAGRVMQTLRAHSVRGDRFRFEEPIDLDIFLEVAIKASAYMSMLSFHHAWRCVARASSDRC
jgi:hypothetical protein